MVETAIEDYDRRRRPGPLPRAGYTSASQSLQDLERGRRLFRAGSGSKANTLISSSSTWACPDSRPELSCSNTCAASPALAPIPVIVLTARDSRDYKQPTLELGAAGLLPEASRQRRTARPYSCFVTAYSLKEPILSLQRVPRVRSIPRIIIRHMVDPSAHRIPPHQPGIAGASACPADFPSRS
jgi:hypothetical protein